jgi:hypothetical protein
MLFQKEKPQLTRLPNLDHIVANIRLYLKFESPSLLILEATPLIFSCIKKSQGSKSHYTIIFMMNQQKQSHIQKMANNTLI